MLKKPQVIFAVDSLIDTANALTYVIYNNISDRNAKLLKDTLHIDVNKVSTLGRDEQYKYILETITPIYNAKLPAIQEKVNEYQEHFDNNAEFIAYELEQIFHVNFSGTQVITAYVSINPVSTFDYNSLAFDLPAGIIQDVMTDTIHRLIDIYFCDIWQSYNPNFNPRNFDLDNHEWILTELAVDPIIAFSRFNQICNEQPLNNFYYQIKVGNVNLMDYIREIYNSNSLEDFMATGLNLLNENPNLVEILK